MRQKLQRVELEWVEMPRRIRDLLKTVTLTADVMFVNGIDFLTTLSHSLRLRATEHIPSRTAKQLGRYIMKRVKLCAFGGFCIRVILMDMEFEKVKDEVELVELNTTAAREHVGEIERSIRVVKKRCRCVYTSPPFAYYHKQLVIHMVYFGTQQARSV